jgi:DNA-binding SARP family transcriptional activator
MFDVRLFGATEVRTPHATLSSRDFGGVKQRHILQLLALNGAMSKAELAEHLWEGNPPAEYVATLESYVSLLRRRIDPDSPARRSVVATRTGGYMLDTDRIRTDVGRFDQLLAAASGLPARAALPMLGEAVALATAPLLADEPYPTWAQDARQRHRTRLAEAATRAAEHALALGDNRYADDLATRATDLDHLAEAAWRVRMNARHAEGDRGGALRHYHTCRQALADELGIEPAGATYELFVRILRADDVRDGDLNNVVAAVLAAARELAATETGADDPTVTLLHRAERLALQVGPRTTTLVRSQRVIGPRTSPERLVTAYAGG